MPKCFINPEWMYSVRLQRPYCRIHVAQKIVPTLPNVRVVEKISLETLFCGQNFVSAY